MIYTHSHYGIYALIFDSSKEKILLIKKGRGAYKGMYDLPGGSPEVGEIPEETIIREVYEETGCQVSKAIDPTEFNIEYKYTKAGQSYILEHSGIIFTTKITGRIKTTPDGEDSLGCEWIKLKNYRGQGKSLSPITTVAINNYQNNF